MFKAKVAVEAIRGERSLNELAGLYQVHPTQIAVWKKRALDGMAALFADGRRKGRGGGRDPPLPRRARKAGRTNDNSLH